jgi:hypothetical protein
MISSGGAVEEPRPVTAWLAAVMPSERVALASKESAPVASAANSESAVARCL